MPTTVRRPACATSPVASSANTANIDDRRNAGRNVSHTARHEAGKVSEVLADALFMDSLGCSELLGEQAWRATGLGASTDIDQLQQSIVTLEQQVVDLRLQLEERDQDLTAARAANRELISQLNASRPTG